MDESLILIGDLAERCGVTTRTIRVYERRGLVAAVARGDNNYRFFDPSIVPEILVFSAMLSFGLSLNEICDIFAASLPIRRRQNANDTRLSMDRAKDVYERHIAAIEAERARLDAVRAALQQRRDNCIRELARSGPIEPPGVRKPQRRAMPGRIEYIHERPDRPLV